MYYSHHRASTVPLPQKEGGFCPLSLATLDSFVFVPLSPADSFAQPQTATLCLLRRHLPFKGVPKVRAEKKSTCLALWERCYSPHRGNVCEADKRVWRPLQGSPYDSLIQLLYEKLVDFFVRQGFGKISSTGAYLLYVTERNFDSNDG